MTRFVVLASVASLITPIDVAAQAWVGVGNGIYIDSKSTARQGDVGSIMARDSQGSLGRMEFDCVKRLWLSPKDGPKEIDQWADGTPLRQTFAAACKRWYEVWK